MRNTSIILLIISALIVSACGDPTGGDPKRDKSGTFIADIQGEFTDAWANMGKFYDSLYNSQWDDVNRWERSNYKGLTHSGAETLRGTVRENSILAAYTCFNDTLAHWSRYSESVMEEQVKGMARIKKDFALNGNLKIDEVEKVYSLFNDAMGFIRGNFSIVPDFSERSLWWTSFDKQKKKYTQKADSIRSSPYFARISSVPEISEGLLTDNLNVKLESKRGGYYCALEKQIEKYYNAKLPLSESDIDELFDIYSRFELQTRSCLQQLSIFIENNKPTN